jgi:leader peptidase (prepilin peptidase) / N-methyltransferase
MMTGMQGAYVILVAGLSGLIWGSFLNVLVYRVPRGLSIVHPGSACPGCGTPIRPVDNVPVVSYLVLAGRCRTCRKGISPEYPLVEFGTGILFAGAAAVLPSPWQAAFVAPFLGLMLAFALIDVRHRIIPNAVVLPSLAVFGCAALVLDLAGAPVSATGALYGMLAYGGGLFLIALVAPGGMGMGDVKLAALIGLVLGGLGLRYVAVAAGLGILAGGVGGVVALARGRGRKDAIPFGPYLAAGAIAATFVGPAVASWYTGFLH